MLQYIVILLDEASTSYCHYIVPSNSPKGKSVMSVETLKKGIRFGMMENLMIQFVYPDYELPEEYASLIESIDHSKIKPVVEGADVLVVNEWGLMPSKSTVPIVIRTSKEDFFVHYNAVFSLLRDAPRVNVVFTDVEGWNNLDFDMYKAILSELGKEVKKLYIEGKTPQLNTLTDRLMLTKMNSCGAGDTTITLAPNGKFYACPAFYYEDETDNIGDLKSGLDIKNKQLYKLEFSPICRHCDAWQCKRCVWLNRALTLEVNTPSREQCIMAHIERNASRELLFSIRKHGIFMPDAEINEIDYLDPFEKRETWNQEN